MAESVIAFPWCVDTHAATEQLALTSLQLGVYGVLQHNRGRGVAGLRFMPGVYLLVDRRDGLVLIDEMLCLGVAWLGVE